MMKEHLERPALRDLDLSLGKRVRLHRLLYGRGPGNGTLLLLCYDQGLELGPAAFHESVEGANPAAAVRLAHDAGCSGIVLGIGLAERYLRELAGRLPLILKLNGKTNVPADDEALAPLNATVEEAVRLAADAVGYTLYPGSPAQYEDFTQLSQVRQDCQAFGMPLIVWARPRGSAIERKGGPKSLYALEYAARVAAELGADAVVLSVPQAQAHRDAQSPKPYNTLQVNQEDAMRRVVHAAGKTLVLLDDGETPNEEDLLRRARLGLEAGASGLCAGPALWLHPPEQARGIAERLRALLGGISD